MSLWTKLVGGGHAGNENKAAKLLANYLGPVITLQPSNIHFHSEPIAASVLGEDDLTLVNVALQGGALNKNMQVPATVVAFTGVSMGQWRMEVIRGALENIFGAKVNVMAQKTDSKRAPQNEAVCFLLRGDIAATLCKHAYSHQREIAQHIRQYASKAVTGSQKLYENCRNLEADLKEEKLYGKLFAQAKKLQPSDPQGLVRRAIEAVLEHWDVPGITPIEEMSVKISLKLNELGQKTRGL